MVSLQRYVLVGGPLHWEYRHVGRLGRYIDK
jgi:hypothetical protein